MMKRDMRHKAFALAAALFAAAWVCPAADRSAQATPPPAVLTAMQDELSRSMQAYSAADPPAYFLSYTVSDRQLADVSGSNGALLSSTEDRARWLEVQSRVGSYQVDDSPRRKPTILQVTPHRSRTLYVSD